MKDLEMCAQIKAAILFFTKCELYCWASTTAQDKLA